MKLSELPGVSTSGPSPGLHPGPSGWDEVSSFPRPSAELGTTAPTIFAMFVTLRMSDAQKVVYWSSITTPLSRIRKNQKDYKKSILGRSYLPL